MAKISMSISESNINVENNTSVITVKLYFYGNGISYNSNNTANGKIIIGNSSKTFKHNFTKSTSAQYMGSYSRTITHNSQGGGSVVCDAWFDTKVGMGTLRIDSVTKKLTTIPRASTITSISPSTVEINGLSHVSLSIDKKNSSFTDKVTATLVDTDKSVEVSHPSSFIIPTSWINNITKDDSAQIEFKVKTYSGSTYIGSSSKRITATIPANIIPTVTSVTVAEANENIPAGFTGFIKNISKLNCQVSASGIQGSTIIQSSSEFLDGNYFGTSFTTNPIQESGTLNINTTVTDSRKRTSAVKETTVSVYDYFYPAITSLRSRALPAGGVEVTIGFKFATVNNQNSGRVTLSWHEQGGTASGNELIFNSSKLSSSSGIYENSITKTFSNLNAEKSYEFTATAQDGLNNQSIPSRLVSASPTISLLNGGQGISFFQEAENPGFWVNNIDYTMPKDGSYLTLANKIGANANQLYDLFSKIIDKVLAVRSVTEGGTGCTTVPQILTLLGIDQLEITPVPDNNLPADAHCYCCYIKAFDMCFFRGTVTKRAAEYKKGDTVRLWTIPAAYKPFNDTGLTLHTGSSALASSYIDSDTGEIRLSQRNNGYVGKGWWIYIAGFWFK